MELSFRQYFSYLGVWGVSIAILCVGVATVNSRTSGDGMIAASSVDMLCAVVAAVASSAPLVCSFSIDFLCGLNDNFTACKLFGVLLTCVNIFALAAGQFHSSSLIFWTIFSLREVLFSCSVFALLSALLQMVIIDTPMAVLQLGFVTLSVVYFVLSSVYLRLNSLVLLLMLLCYGALTAVAARRFSELLQELQSSRIFPMAVCFCLLALRPLLFGLRYSLSRIPATHPLDSLLIYSDCLLMVLLSICPAWIQHTDDMHKLRAQRIFVRHVSHEMRSPLNTVYIGLQLLTDDYILPYVRQMKQQPSLMVKADQSPSETSEAIAPPCTDHGGFGMELPPLLLSPINSCNNISPLDTDRQVLASTPLQLTSDDELATSKRITSTVALSSTGSNYPLTGLRELTSNITASCETALDILNELLLLDKISDSSMPLDLTIAPMLQFIRKTYRYMDIESRHKQIRLVKPDLMLLSSVHRRIVRHGSLLIDRNKLAKVYRNVLSNALKFTPRGGSVTLALTLLDAENEGANLIDDSQPETKAILREATARGYKLSHIVRYSVTDTGVGLDPADESKLFKEFVQIAPSVNQEGQGTGLGLYISRRIVELHGGSITVSSPGMQQGSTFTIDLPMFLLEHKNDSSSTSIRNENDLPRCNSVEDEESVREFRTDRQAPVSPPLGVISTKHIDELPPLNGGAQNKYLDVSSPALIPPRANNSGERQKLRRILIVDDSNVTVKLMTSLMRSRAEEIVGVTSGEEALEEVKKCQQRAENIEAQIIMFDCVFLDHQMNGLDGPATANALREMGYNGLIIGLTGMMEEEDVMHFKTCGADAVMGKPLSVSALDIVLQDARDQPSNVSMDHVRGKFRGSALSGSVWVEDAASLTPKQSSRLDAFQKNNSLSVSGSRVYPERSPTADASWNMSSLSSYPDTSGNRNQFRVPFG